MTSQPLAARPAAGTDTTDYVTVFVGETMFGLTIDRVHVDGTDYAERATLRLDAEPQERDELAALVAELTGGAGVLVDGPTDYRTHPR